MWCNGLSIGYIGLLCNYSLGTMNNCDAIDKSMETDVHNTGDARHYTGLGTLSTVQWAEYGD